jgi:hypothetical protein
VFLLRCQPSNYGQLSGILDQVCRVFGRNSDDFQNEFLLVVTGRILNGEVPLLAVYFDVV